MRLSVVDLNEERQLDGLALDRTFLDKASGREVQRPQLAALLFFVRDR